MHHPPKITCQWKIIIFNRFCYCHVSVPALRVVHYYDNAIDLMRLAEDNDGLIKIVMRMIW